MVQEAMRIVETITDKAVQLKVIEAIRSVTEGKIYVEVERARITYKLAIMLESEGKIQEGAEVLQDLQVNVSGWLYAQRVCKDFLQSCTSFICFCTLDRDIRIDGPSRKG